MFLSVFTGNVVGTGNPFAKQLTVSLVQNLRWMLKRHFVDVETTLYMCFLTLCAGRNMIEKKV